MCVHRPTTSASPCGDADILCGRNRGSSKLNGLLILEQKRRSLLYTICPFAVVAMDSAPFVRLLLLPMPKSLVEHHRVPWHAHRSAAIRTSWIRGMTRLILYQKHRRRLSSNPNLHTAPKLSHPLPSQTLHYPNYPKLSHPLASQTLHSGPASVKDVYTLASRRNCRTPDMSTLQRIRIKNKNACARSYGEAEKHRSLYDSRLLYNESTERR